MRDVKVKAVSKLFDTAFTFMLTQRAFLWSFAECGNHKALRLKAQGVYFCK